MKNLGRNSLAAGLGTLLVTGALSFSAQATHQAEAYSEAEFVVAIDEGLGGLLIDPVVDEIIESPGTFAHFDGGPPSDSTESALGDVLAQLTGPLGDALAGADGVGVVGNYAEAADAHAYAAAGAVGSDGAIALSEKGDPSNPVARLRLSDGALGPLADLVADVGLDVQAVTGWAEHDGGAEPNWSNGGLDYHIAGADLVLQIPAVTAVNDALSDLPTDALDPLEVGASDICALVEELGAALIGDLPIGDDIDLCEQAGNLDLVTLRLQGLGAITDGLTSVSQDGIEIDFTTGEVHLDLDALLTILGTDINDLAENTNLLAEVLPALVDNLDELLATAVEDLIDRVLDEVRVVATLDVPVVGPVEILDIGLGDDLGPVLQEVLTPLFSGLGTVLETVEGPLGEALETIAEELAVVLEVLVNVPNDYRDAALQRDGGLYADLHHEADPSNTFSQTALRVSVLDGMAADLLLGNALVTVTEGIPHADDQDADAQADADGQDADAQADADSQADADAVADADADRDGTDAISDADGTADAGTLDTLPETGAPNLLPLWLLALALILFGTAVLANERRRAAALAG